MNKVARATAKVVHPVTQCEANGVSDHAPIQVTLRSKKMPPAHMRPIPKWLAKHKIFKDVVKELEEEALLDKLEPHDRWLTHKKIIRQASQIAAKR